MVFGVVRQEMTMDFGSKEVESMLDEGVVHVFYLHVIA